MLHLSDKMLQIDTKENERRIVLLIRSYLKSSNSSSVVIGMSGGLDSSVVAVLARRALGSRSVIGVALPEKGVTDHQDLDDAKGLAAKLGIKFHNIDISTPFKSLTSIIPLYDPAELLVTGNLKARIRMLILYYIANRRNALVLGTSNRSELLTGYFTKYGDGAFDLAPLSGLYKSQVYQLASHLKIPQRIIDKKPTAGLWPGQFDEDEIGVEYQLLDKILYCFENNITENEIARLLKIPLKTVRKIHFRMALNEHKRQKPLMASPI
jgi:NAD+ synthase